MCGINGIFSFNSDKSYVETIKKMNGLIAQRGPDSEGTFFSKKISFGHRRLSIIDLSKNANQPFNSADNRFTIVFNGEIYNYRELKKQLDYPFKTKSDTEVIIASYIKWGKECVKHFNGMFSFAIWDNYEETLFISRDRLGIKPLYYYKDNEKLIFSSSLKAILKSNIIDPKIDENQLNNYYRFHTVFSPHTLIQNVSTLEAGTSIYISKNNYTKSTYWNIRDKALINESISYDEAKLQINKLLNNSVEERLVSDVDFGAFLSGGIDSSLMLALMSKQSTSKIKTFTVAFGEKEYNESHYAKELAEKYNSDHTNIEISATDILDNVIPALQNLDFPSSDGINTFIVSKKTREAGIKMAISGLGGDELFAGYPQFKQINNLEKLELFNKIPNKIKSSTANLLLNIKDNRTQKISKWLKLSNIDFKSIYPTFRDQSYYGGSILLNNNELNNDYFNNSSPLNNLSVNEVQYYLESILLRDSDQMSMANSLELRVPFMDHNLIEYVLSLPDSYKYPEVQKKLLTESFPEVFTKEMLARKKMGFVLPWNIWLKTELKEFTVLRLNYLKKYSFFNNELIERMWQEFLKGDKRIAWTQIWNLVVLSYWLEDIFE